MRYWYHGASNHGARAQSPRNSTTYTKGRQPSEDPTECGKTQEANSRDVFLRQPSGFLDTEVRQVVTLTTSHTAGKTANRRENSKARRHGVLPWAFNSLARILKDASSSYANSQKGLLKTVKKAMLNPDAGRAYTSSKAIVSFMSLLVMRLEVTCPLHLQYELAPATTQVWLFLHRSRPPAPPRRVSHEDCSEVPILPMAHATLPINRPTRISRSLSICSSLSIWLRSLKPKIRPSIVVKTSWAGS